MKRYFTILVPALAAAAIAVPGAAAKEGEKVTVTPPVANVAPGSIWHVTLRYTEAGGKPWIVSGYPPIVDLKNAQTGRLLFAQTHGIRKTGVWKATLRLPKSGTWSLAIDDGYSFSEDEWSKPFTVGGKGGSFPILPLVGGTFAGLILGLMALLIRRLSHPGSLATAHRPSH